PRVGEAVVRVLRHFGCDVHIAAGQTCCGQPAFNSGFHREAMAVAQHWISIFEPFERVVTPSASCAAMVKHHLPELFAADSGWHRRARRLSEQTHEFTVFLRDMLGVDAAEHLHFGERFTYHYPCHARDIYPLT